ncbi:sulfur oxidation c-type cytochrome SoxX [Paracoccus sp. S-4012]|uniref:sulfur oxidation c-type cytochrome SoxX n=1 Tax=Paracoccus sp. S-4012 TaxID=2665648 RepID=UPI0018A1DDF1|nr:sulfur oxidation c-type cytochrome SoxX [Paracoccus sp. S-4012]
MAATRLACCVTALSLAAPAWAQDPARGLALMRDSQKGNCSICHLVPGIGLPEDAQGNIGPSLAGVGARLSLAELHARITDARIGNPDTMMPPYGTTEGLVDVDPRYRGRPILTPGEIGDVAAYLSGLTEDAP